MITTFEQQQRSHKRGLQKKPMERILYLFEYRLLKHLQEPRNRYQLVIHTFVKYKELDPVLLKYLRLGLIRPTDFNPNKFILTEKGTRTLFLLQELNKMIDKYVTIEDL